jgi:hypothetical protein
MPSLESRQHLLRRLLHKPRELRSELLDVLRLGGMWAYQEMSDKQLLRELDIQFYRPLNEVGVPRRHLCAGYWTDQMVPMLKSLLVDE